MWDSCTASTGAMTFQAVWSPCGQFITAAYKERIQVQDSSTLETVSVLMHPDNTPFNGDFTTPTLTFSPNGRLLAYNQ